MYFGEETFLFKVFQLCEHLLLLELNALHDSVNGEQTFKVRDYHAFEDNERRCEQDSQPRVLYLIHEQAEP